MSGILKVELNDYEFRRFCEEIGNLLAEQDTLSSGAEIRAGLLLLTENGGLAGAIDFLKQLQETSVKALPLNCRPIRGHPEPDSVHVTRVKDKH